MSTHGPIETPKEQRLKDNNLGPVILGLGIVGIASVVISLIWGSSNPGQLAFSWLFGFFFFFSISAGALFWILLHHATDSGWSVVVRRQMENLASLFPLLVILFIPLVYLGHDYLWSWMRIDPHTNHLMHHKAGFLNEPFFWIRAVLYAVFFVGATFLFRRYSLQQDLSGDVRWTLRSRVLTFVSLPLFGVFITFAAIDWLMSLDYSWFSTMFGVYIFSGSALSSMAVLILLVTLLLNKGYLKDIVTIEHYHIMGKLLFAFTVFWAYIGYSQYMLIWYANIPEETSYFIRRTTESWHTLSSILVIGHFFLPFLLLLGQRFKKDPRLLSAVSLWILIMHVLDVYLMVMPILHPQGVQLHLLDLLAPLGIGCCLAVFLLIRIGKAPLFPYRDPRVIESIQATN